VSIMLHELGHFWTARRSGMRATQFFLGFGPRVWSTHRNGVEYGVRAIPLGGFVKIIGMTNIDEVAEEDEPHTYRQGSYPRRMWVITAGSVMHMIIAVVLIVIVFMAWGRVEEVGRVTLAEVTADSPAAAAGLRNGDIIVTANGDAVTEAGAFRDILSSTPPGEELTLEVLRDGTPLTIAATLIQNPSTEEVRGYLGVFPVSDERVQQSFGEAIVDGPSDLVEGVGQAIVGVAKVINPISVFGHLTGTNDDPTSKPGTIVGATKVARRRRRAHHGAVDDDHQDGRRRGHAAADLRTRRRRLRHRAVHLQRDRGGRGARPDRAPQPGADRRRHPPPVQDGARRARGRRALPPAQPRQHPQPEHIKLVAKEAKDRGVPIRIGVNGGSLDPALYEKYGGKVTPEAMVESAQQELAYFDEVGFDNVKISVKASSVPLMIEAYRSWRGHRSSAAPRRHRGRAPPSPGLLKATAGIATLLAEGIGDTIRYSLTADPVEEARAGRSCSRRWGCASARTSTSSPARRAAAPRST
jgi:hypothetical protein